MKTIQLFSFFLLPFIISCNVVTFDKPIPEDGTTLDIFPKSLIGNYYSADRMFDSAIYNEKFYPDIYKKKDSVLVASFHVAVTKNTVTYTTVEKNYYDTSKIDIHTIASASLRNNASRRNIGSYVLVESVEQKEFINLSKDVLKEKDGIYYLNIKNDEQEWHTLQITKGKKGILHVNMFMADDLKSLPAGFHIEQKGFSSIIHDLTPAQFDYLIQHTYFEKLFSLKKE